MLKLLVCKQDYINPEAMVSLCKIFIQRTSVGRQYNNAERTKTVLVLSE